MFSPLSRHEQAYLRRRLIWPWRRQSCFRALRADQLDEAGRRIIDAVEIADVLVVGSPSTGILHRRVEASLRSRRFFVALQASGWFLAATGGTPLHGLMQSISSGRYSASLAPYRANDDLCAVEGGLHRLHAFRTRPSKHVSSVPLQNCSIFCGGGPSLRQSSSAPRAALREAVVTDIRKEEFT